jgi:hypothetical protein
MENDDSLLADLQTAHAQQARKVLDECLSNTPVAQDLQELINERIERYRRALASLHQTTEAMDSASAAMKQQLQDYIQERSKHL